MHTTGLFPEIWSPLGSSLLVTNERAFLTVGILEDWLHSYVLQLKYGKSTPFAANTVSVHLHNSLCSIKGIAGCVSLLLPKLPKVIHNGLAAWKICAMIEKYSIGNTQLLPSWKYHSKDMYTLWVNFNGSLTIRSRPWKSTCSTWLEKSYLVSSNPDWYLSNYTYLHIQYHSFLLNYWYLPGRGGAEYNLRNLHRVSISLPPVECITTQKSHYAPANHQACHL